MQHTTPDIIAVRDLHQSGKLDEAKSGYLAILKNTARDNICYAPVCNNLGTIFYKQGDIEQAIFYYREAIQQQSNYIDAYYNLGLALTQKNLFDDAAITYQQLLAMEPLHWGARFQLAVILLCEERIDAALNAFLEIAEAKPYHFETKSNIAVCYLRQGKLDEAKKYYKQALDLNAEDPHILFNLGCICMQKNFIDEAIIYLQRAVHINPNLFEAHNNLGVALLKKQYRGLALTHFQHALALQPDHPGLAYTVNMLSENPDQVTAPAEYIQTLFDAYADHYEPHLLTALDYQLPQVFYKMLSRHLKKHKLLDILDVGCGTGLCAVPFQKFAKTLTGVDLSSKMLNIAKEKNIYHKLVLQDITEFLKDEKSEYDLIIAGDVFVYYGELEEIFKYIFNILRSNGLFIFNTEVLLSEENLNSYQNYRKNQSGRFLHHKNYVDKLAERYQFELLYYQAITTRTQHNEPVAGHGYVLRKK